MNRRTNILIVDEAGRAVAVLRTLDIIHLAEAFLAQVMNSRPAISRFWNRGCVTT
jgi:hypothetical protein